VIRFETGRDDEGSSQAGLLAEKLSLP